jgi:hypothetical protein
MSVFPDPNSCRTSSAPGQGGLIAVAITILIALVLASTSLSDFASLNAKRSVVTKESLQTYYIAQAGIQEAMASRMVPRSNYLNFSAVKPPFLASSGLVYQDPATKQNLLGEYRYIILGGDAARQADGSYYPDNSMSLAGIPRLLTTDSIPDSSPFIVISKATVCKKATTRSLVALNQLNTGITPTCKAGYIADELTLVAESRLDREHASGVSLMDRTDKVRIFKNSAQIQLPAGASVPGYATWQNANATINFDTAWNQGAVELKRVVFYNFTDNTIYADVPVVGASTTVATPIPTKAVIRLYFGGPVDYRAISPTYDRQLADCKGAGASTCRIRLMQNTDALGQGGTAYTGNLMMPLLPVGSHIVMLPPLTGQIAAGGVRHAIKVDATQLRTANGTPGTVNYTINFVTQ